MKRYHPRLVRKYHLAFLCGLLIVNLSEIALCQPSRSELVNTGMYSSGTSVVSGKHYDAILLKERVGEATVQGKKCDKIRWTSFSNLDSAKVTYTEFERLADREYFVADEHGTVRYQIKLLPGIKQEGTILGKSGAIISSFIDTRGYFPRDSLVPDESTPIKFSLASDTTYSLTYLPKLNVISTATAGKRFIELMGGETFYELKRGLPNTAPIHSHFDISPGDEVQLLYRHVSINDTTNMMTSQPKQTILMIYKGDTIIDHRKLLLVSYQSFNFDVGTEEAEQTVAVRVTDSLMYFNSDMLKVPTTFKPELKIDTIRLPEGFAEPPRVSAPQKGYQEEPKANMLSFSAYLYDTIGGKAFPRVIMASSEDPFTYYALPYFPAFYVTYPGTDGVITYVKHNGKEYGKKIPHMYPTDKTFIRSMRCVGKNAVKMDVYFKEPCDAHVLFYVSETEQKEIDHEQIEQAGFRTIMLTTPDLKQGEQYQLQLEMKQGNVSSILTQQFTANY